MTAPVSGKRRRVHEVMVHSKIAIVFYRILSKKKAGYGVRFSREIGGQF